MKVIPSSRKGDFEGGPSQIHKQAEGHRRRPPLDAGEEGDGCCCSGGGIDPIKDANRRMPLPPDGAT
ncbi:hypothetical protein PVAP13_2KG203000 [Panicum virgatum]|uniref:Uncharacterized protein n=1 Tax=Panicum virgatum TaxID=38727 RepID=A0A8T0WDX8_PANVG|nr:hypothetical protein PVAP13_2KG203000 [Panicum virgatum]